MPAYAPGILTGPITKTVTFTGAAGNGAVGNVVLYTVSGLVIGATIVPKCTEGLVSAGGGSVSLGTVSDTDLFILATTATAIAIGDLWLDATPTEASMAVPAALKDVAVNNENIVMEVTVGGVTDGTLVFELWALLAPGATVAAA